MALANNKLLTAADLNFSLHTPLFLQKHNHSSEYEYYFEESSSKTQPPLAITFNTSIYYLGLSSIVIMQIITVHEDDTKNVKRKTKNGRDEF